MRPKLESTEVTSRRVTRASIDALYMAFEMVKVLQDGLHKVIKSIQDTCHHPTVIGGKGNRICQCCGKRISERKMRERKKKGRKK